MTKTCTVMISVTVTFDHAGSAYFLHLLREKKSSAPSDTIPKFPLKSETFPSSQHNRRPVRHRCSVFGDFLDLLPAISRLFSFSAVVGGCCQFEDYRSVHASFETYIENVEKKVEVQSIPDILK
ncbi:hypothetical protein L1049_013342 [Liquidambar formosana]|uniref:Uncharacterized protein n=1 Tax=Liquidambar formosana TaxID=63359 RepID=A0AAP0RNN6_LIQFO